MGGEAKKLIGYRRNYFRADRRFVYFFDSFVSRVKC